MVLASRQGRMWERTGLQNVICREQRLSPNSFTSHQTNTGKPHKIQLPSMMSKYVHASAKSITFLLPPP